MLHPTNFITIPDFVATQQHTILLVDVDPDDIETLAHMCSNYAESFNVYLYYASNNDTQWLERAAALADTIIVNTVQNELSNIKDTYIVQGRTMYYGPKTFQYGNQCRTVLDYFANRENERKSTHNFVSLL